MSSEPSTLADQVGTCAGVLKPLYSLIEAHVLAAERLHGDDTTVPVLAKGKTITGRLWTYVRDDRPFGGPAPPAAVFYYSRDRTGEHPQRHLHTYAGIFQADAYGGYNKLYEEGRHPGLVLEAACWVHARRRFFVLADCCQRPAQSADRTPAVISPLALRRSVASTPCLTSNARSTAGRRSAPGRAPERAPAGRRAGRLDASGTRQVVAP